MPIVVGTKVISLWKLLEVNVYLVELEIFAEFSLQFALSLRITLMNAVVLYQFFFGFNLQV